MLDQLHEMGVFACVVEKKILLAVQQENWALQPVRSVNKSDL